MSYRKAKLLLQKKKMEQKNYDDGENKVKQKEELQQQTDVFQKKANNIFKALQDSDEEREDEKITEISQKKQQEKNIEQQKSTKQSETKKKKNKNKKKKQKHETEKKNQENIQEILKQVGLDCKVKKQEKIKQEEQWQTILQINQNKFNYEKQLRRHFGNNNAFHEQDRNDSQIDKREQKLQKHLKKSMKKSMLLPSLKQFFLIREKFDVSREGNLIKFIPSKKYQHYQVEYEAIRNSNDVNALFMFMQSHPEHVDSIYAVGEFLRLQGNYRDADNLIQRVIYIYEIADSYDFSDFIKEDLIKKEIVYETYSTSLFMSLFKFMAILGKKGCYRSALQYNKFLLKININDPTACILFIDFNSISAKCYEYLLKFIQGFSRYVGDKKSSLYLMPNFTFSAALAKYYIDSSEKSENTLVVEQKNTQHLLKFDDDDWKNALKLPQNDSFINESSKVLILRALITYPKLMVDIAKKNEYIKQSINYPGYEGNQKKHFKDLLSHQFWQNVPVSYSYNFLKLQSQADSKGLDKILEVYVERSKILWRSNQIMLLVKGAMGFILNKIQDNSFDYQEYLEKLCLENGGGLSIPFQLRRYANISKSNFSDRVQRIDLANIQDNQQIQAPQNQNVMSVEGNPVLLFLNSLLPWVSLPNNQQNNDPDMPDIQEDDDWL